MKPKFVHDALRARLLRVVDLINNRPEPLKLEDLEKSEWSPEFERLMRNRLIMGGLRYGLISGNKGKPYDRVGSCVKRLRAYQETGNLEHLVDVANLCLCEYLHGTHPRRHFAAADDGIHTQLRK